MKTKTNKSSYREGAEDAEGTIIVFATAAIVVAAALKKILA